MHGPHSLVRIGPGCAGRANLHWLVSFTCCVSDAKWPPALELFIRFTVPACRESQSFYAGRIWEANVAVPVYRLSFYFSIKAPLGWMDGLMGGWLAILHRKSFSTVFQ